MYVLQQHLVKGRTHVETVYLTLLEHVLNNKLSFDNFMSLFIDYVYRSVIKPLLVRNPELNKHFKLYVDRAFSQVYPLYIRVNVDIPPPGFTESEAEPYMHCVEYLSNHSHKIFSEEEIRERRDEQVIHALCREVIYVASMALLRDLGLIR